MKLQGRSRKRMPIMHFTRANAISRQIFTQETIVFLSTSDSKSTTTTARLACQVKAHKGQRAVAAISGEILAQKPEGMKCCKGQILRVDLKNIREIPLLYVPKDWKRKLTRKGFCSARLKMSGDRIVLQEIPEDCWIRGTRGGYELCNYKIIQT